MNKTVVITGAGGVLCSAFAKHLASLGCRVALIGRTAATLEAVKSEIESAGGTAGVYPADVLDKAALKAAHEKIKRDFGPCDVLINGAGGNDPRGTTSREEFTPGDEAEKELATFFSLDEAGFDAVFDLNLKGTLLPTQEFAADMIGRAGCCILNVSSMNAFRPLTKIPAYSAAKAAVSNFTAWLAVHFAKSGIRVNAIAPGFFVTKQNRALLFDDSGKPTARTEKILRATPMGRFGKPEELLGTLEWLADETKSGFVTGVVVPVDGGFSAYSGV
ncbi:MAG: SDR family oxidoreductase [Oscillospiraceae bacterium]|nr:SDR family oxidoreductase [Oscillospiraceae bacterium]